MFSGRVIRAICNRRGKALCGAFLSVLFLFLASSSATAQDLGQDRDSLVRLIEAKSIKLTEIGGSPFRIVMGPARFLHNNTYLLCDSAAWDVNANVIDAMGHVQIIQNDTYLVSDIHNILENGYKDVNPRPKYEDGTPAYTISVNHVTRKYDLSKGEFPIPFACCSSAPFPLPVVYSALYIFLNPSLHSFFFPDII